MISDNAFDLKNFEIVESSEQGMLAQVSRAERREDWIVFLGWEPHPMNANFELGVPLTGGDDWFGPNLGGATVYTNVRAGYLADCPNVGALLTNLSFSLAMENEIMGAILNDGRGAGGCRLGLADGQSGRARRLAGRSHDRRRRRRHGGGQIGSRAVETTVKAGAGLGLEAALSSLLTERLMVWRYPPHPPASRAPSLSPRRGN